MTAHNRYLRGGYNTSLVDIHSYTVVEAGDFLFRAATDGDLGAGISADYYGYPFDRARAVSAGTAILETIYTDFLGVAMESSPSGTTEKITVATSGIFRYPMYKVFGVSIGQLIAAVTPAAGPAAGVSNQAVFNSASAPGSSAYLGYCVKTQSGASFVDFQIRTAFDGGLAS